MLMKLECRAVLSCAGRMVSSVLRHIFCSLVPPYLLILTVIMRIREVGFWQNPELIVVVVVGGREMNGWEVKIHCDSEWCASFWSTQSYFALNEVYGESLSTCNFAVLNTNGELAMEVLEGENLLSDDFTLYVSLWICVSVCVCVREIECDDVYMCLCIGIYSNSQFRSRRHKTCNSDKVYAYP